MLRSTSNMTASALTLASLLLSSLSDVACFQIQLRQSKSHTNQFHSIRRTVTHLSSTVNIDSAVTEEVSLSGPPAISARDLTCTFDGGETYQLDSASYVLPRGARVGLVGRNGCGKVNDWFQLYALFTIRLVRQITHFSFLHNHLQSDRVPF